MMRRVAFAAVLGLLAWTPQAQAQAQPPVRLTVDDAIARATEVSHRLAEARARQEGAQARVQSARAARQPTLGVTGGYTRTNHVEEFGVPQPAGGIRIIYPDIPDNFFTRAYVQWPIYTAGRVDALERAAEAEGRAAGADVAVARADLRLEVVRVYWALATAAESVRVLQEALDRAEAHVRDARSRFDSGLIPPNEVASAEAQRSRHELQWLESRNVRESVLEELRRLTGLVGDIALADALDPPPPAVEGALDRAARAERQALADRILAADERQRAVQAGRRPTVSFTGGVDYANPNPRIFPRRRGWRESWEIGVAASWTIWDSGRVAADAADAAATASALRARLAEVDSQIALDVRQRALDLDTARAAVVAARDGVRSAAEARRVVAERFRVGVATSTEVLDAQVALLQAELDRTRVLANIRLAEARLDRALGR
jgi:outer membrane protein